MKFIKQLIITNIFIFFFLTTAYFLIISSQTPIINGSSQEKIIYFLPYPGILPDHPLYFLKNLRDKVQEFLNRDNLKKARLYLLHSDKKAAMAIALANKGKNQLSINIFLKGEKDFEKIFYYLSLAKLQGQSAPSDFIDTLKLANAKHNELIFELMKITPEGLQNSLNQLLDLNLSIKKTIEKLP